MISTTLAVDRYLDAWNAHHTEAIVAAFAEGGTYSDPSAGTLSGPAIGIYAGALFAAFPDLRFDVQAIGQMDDGAVVSRWVMRGTHTGPLLGRPPTGSEIAVPGIDAIAVEGDRLRSVVGYFDQKLFLEQLGMEVHVTPESNARVQYGVAAYVNSGRPTRPGAFSATWIEVRDEHETQQVRDSVLQVVAEVAPDPAFISWLGAAVGKRMFTATAWSEAEAAERLLRGPAHRRAMELVFQAGLGTAIHTSMWTTPHQNALRVRCPTCGMLNDAGTPHCHCRASLPPAPAYW